MPYTDNPSGNPLDAVRLLIGDIKAAEELSDSAIAFLLSEKGGDIRRAAATAAETLSAKYAGTSSSRRVGPLDITYGTRGQTKAMEYAKLAKILWAQALSSVGPFAGGISVSDKVARASDGDVVQPSIRRRMMPYRQGVTSDRLVTPEEILSSPDIQP